VFWLSLSPTTFYIIHFFCKIQDGLAFWYWLAQDVMELAIIAIATVQQQLHSLSKTKDCVQFRLLFACLQVSSVSSTVSKEMSDIYQ